MLFSTSAPSSLYAFGGFSTDKLSHRTWLMAEGRLGYSGDFSFLLEKPDTLVRSNSPSRDPSVLAISLELQMARTSEL